jgi:bisphosphoglycerate-dependent phosphoglycerate mutase
MIKGDFKVTTLLLVRHGESEANRNEIFAGHFDADLENRGLMQAQKTAEYIKENYNNHEDIAEAETLEELLDALNYYTWAVQTTDNNILYQCF